MPQPRRRVGGVDGASGPVMQGRLLWAATDGQAGGVEGCLSQPPLTPPPLPRPRPILRHLRL